jgi:hypothetical protein
MSDLRCSVPEQSRRSQRMRVLARLFGKRRGAVIVICSRPVKASSKLEFGNSASQQQQSISSVTDEGSEGHADRSKHNHRQQDHNTGMAPRDHNFHLRWQCPLLMFYAFQIRAVHQSRLLHCNLFVALSFLERPDVVIRRHCAPRRNSRHTGRAYRTRWRPALAALGKVNGSPPAISGCGAHAGSPCE